MPNIAWGLPLDTEAVPLPAGVTLKGVATKTQHHGKLLVVDSYALV